MERNHRERMSLSAWAMLALMACAVLLVLYVLGIGPASWLMLHDYISQDIYASIYHPLISVSERFPPLANFIVYWVALWNP